MLVCRAGGQGLDSYSLNNRTGLKKTKTLKKDLPLPCERLVELRLAQITASKMAVSSPEGHVTTEPSCLISTSVFAKDYGTLKNYIVGFCNFSL